MMHAVLKTWHPMVGIDLHMPWVPGTPSPAPSPVPYATFYTMLGTSLTATYAKDYYSHSWGLTMLKPTDIGPMIPHIGPPSLLTPLEIVTSWSKSYFGSSRCKSAGTPVAVALLFIENLNLPSTGITRSSWGPPCSTPSPCCSAISSPT